jgi:uncharacterized protein
VADETTPASDTQGGCLVHVRVLPRGSRDELVGLRDGRICVRTTAPPVEGAANRRVTEFLAKALDVRRSHVTIVGGEKSREKTLLVEGLSAAEALRRLLP